MRHIITPWGTRLCSSPEPRADELPDRNFTYVAPDLCKDCVLRSAAILKAIGYYDEPTRFPK